MKRLLCVSLGLTMLSGCALSVPSVPNAPSTATKTNTVKAADGAKRPDVTAVLPTATDETAPSGTKPIAVTDAEANLAVELEPGPSFNFPAAVTPPLPPVLAGLIGMDSASLIGMDSASLLGMDGASLLGMDGASLIGMDSASYNLLATAQFDVCAASVKVSPVDAMRGSVGLLGVALVDAARVLGAATAVRGSTEITRTVAGVDETIAWRPSGGGADIFLSLGKRLADRPPAVTIHLDSPTKGYVARSFDIKEMRKLNWQRLLKRGSINGVELTLSDAMRDDLTFDGAYKLTFDLDSGKTVLESRLNVGLGDSSRALFEAAMRTAGVVESEITERLAKLKTEAVSFNQVQEFLLEPGADTFRYRSNIFQGMATVQTAVGCATVGRCLAADFQADGQAALRVSLTDKNDNEFAWVKADGTLSDDRTAGESFLDAKGLPRQAGADLTVRVSGERLARLDSQNLLQVLPPPPTDLKPIADLVKNGRTIVPSSNWGEIGGKWADKEAGDESTTAGLDRKVSEKFAGWKTVTTTTYAVPTVKAIARATTEATARTTTEATARTTTEATARTTTEATARTTTEATAKTTKVDGTRVITVEKRPVETTTDDTIEKRSGTTTEKTSEETEGGRLPLGTVRSGGTTLAVPTVPRTSVAKS